MTEQKNQTPTNEMNLLPGSNLGHAVTLNMLGDPSNTLGSTMAITATIHNQYRTFSFQPILFYAVMAKHIASSGFGSEKEAENKGMNVFSIANELLKQTARDIYFHVQIAPGDDSLDGYVSGHIQNGLLQQILGDSSIIHPLHINDKTAVKSVSMNCAKAKKNITIPGYLMSRLSLYLGSEEAARLYIHGIAFNIKKELDKKGFLDSKGELIGAAGNSSWSRKVHNAIIMKLIDMAGLNRRYPTLCSVPMIRQYRLETAYQRNQLKR